MSRFTIAANDNLDVTQHHLSNLEHMKSMKGEVHDIKDSLIKDKLTKARVELKRTSNITKTILTDNKSQR